MRLKTGGKSKAEVLGPGTRTEGQGGKAEAPSVPGDASPRPRSGYVPDVVHSEHFRVVTPIGGERGSEFITPRQNRKKCR